MNNYDEIISAFNKIGFKVKAEYEPDTTYIILERLVEGTKIHQVILEDHRWEKAEEDFDPKNDIGEWLIFSFLINDVRDYYGHFVETQYPLTLPEIHLIEKLIEVLEEKLKCKLNEVI